MQACEIIFPIQYQVSMTDVDEKTGIVACTELQKEYSTKSVIFTRCDVTKPDELVSYDQQANNI